jgi:hypothetical protein
MHFAVGMKLALEGSSASCNLDFSDEELFMETGTKLNLTRTIRSAKTGMLLPKEGTLVSVTENLGRTLLLVEFEGGLLEYLFEHEVQLENGDASRTSAVVPVMTPIFSQVS